MRGDGGREGSAGLWCHLGPSDILEWNMRKTGAAFWLSLWIVQNLNITTKETVWRTDELWKTSSISLKGFWRSHSACVFFFFSDVHSKILQLTWQNIWGHVTSSIQVKMLSYVRTEEETEPFLTAITETSKQNKRKHDLLLLVNICKSILSFRMWEISLLFY